MLFLGRDVVGNVLSLVQAGGCFLDDVVLDQHPVLSVCVCVCARFDGWAWIQRAGRVFYE